MNEEARYVYEEQLRLIEEDEACAVEAAHLSAALKRIDARRKYIHAQEKALLATMSYARPQPEGEGGEHYVVTVASPTEQKYVEERKEALLSFLCDAVKNDRLMLDVKVSDKPMETPKILSPREVVEQIKQHNPNFNQFLKDFDLGLA